MSKRVASKRGSSRSVNDFEKRKRKLGSKVGSSNSTNTSFKARSISLPQQSISRDKINALVSKRNLTLEQLLVQLRHPNANIRREALQGLLEIHQIHPGLSRHSHSVTMPNVVRLVADEDRAVRRAFLTFLAAYLRQLSNLLVQPYTSLLLLHIGSAMSHIFPDVRLDAIRALDICLSNFGSLIVADWQANGPWNVAHLSISMDLERNSDSVATADTHFARLLRTYLTILGIPQDAVFKRHPYSSSRHTSKAAVLATDMSKSALHTVLRSLLTLLQQAFAGKGIRNATADADADEANAEEEVDENKAESESHLDCPLWFLLPSLQHVSDKEWFARCLTVRPIKFDHHSAERQLAFSDAIFDSDAVRTASETDVSVDGARLLKAFHSTSLVKDSAIGASPETDRNTSASFQLALFEALCPLLLTAFMDAAPTAFDVAFAGNTDLLRSKTDDDAARDIVAVVIALTLQLWRGVRCASKEQVALLSKILSRIAPHFPLPNQGEYLALEDDFWLDLNLSYCELISIRASNVSSKDSRQTIEKQVSEVGDFIVKALERSKETKNPSLRRDQTVLCNVRRFIALLPSVWLILDRQNDDEDPNTADNLIHALLSHWRRLHWSNVTKRISSQFIGYLLHLERSHSYSGRFCLMRSNVRRTAIVEWLTQSVPRLLWELNDKDHRGTKMLLNILRSIAIWSEDGDNDRKTSDERWRDEVVKAVQKPFATFFHVHHPHHGSVPGPYIRLPSSIQRDAQALLSYLSPLDATLFVSATRVGALSSEER